ncbi:MAG: GGDEF domain-containing protein [Firmicutes bacterium]|nr:GGDEF domain-containing protein [Gammaproteobacteria bacterium]MCL5049442.1 GGDEF domain-containing protein [Bacillota bacterium]
MKLAPHLSPLVNSERHQLRLLRIVLVVLFIFSCAIGSLNVFVFNAYQIATFNFISAAASVLIWFYLRSTSNLRVASWLLIAAVLFNLSAFIGSSKGAAYSIIWVTVLPPLAFFLLGRRAGSWVTGIAFLGTVAFLVLYLRTLPEVNFTAGAILNIAEVMLVLWLIFRFYEGSRSAAYAELERLSVIDKLTGVYNRSKLDQLLEGHIQLAARAGMPLCVILFDIDHFKRVNDRYGHLHGDLVLQQVTSAIQGAVRQTDEFGRWGGEEFLLLCPATSVADGMVLANKLREVVSAAVETDDGELTISAGLTCVDSLTSPAAAIREADHALYAAKSSGRNKVVRYSSELETLQNFI